MSIVRAVSFPWEMVPWCAPAIALGIAVLLLETAKDKFHAMR